MSEALSHYGKYLMHVYEGTAGIGEQKKVCRIMTESGECLPTATDARVEAAALLRVTADLLEASVDLEKQAKRSSWLADRSRTAVAHRMAMEDHMAAAAGGHNQDAHLERAAYHKTEADLLEGKHSKRTKPS